MITTDSIKNIADIIRALRKYNQLQQSELANILGVTQGTISKVESGNMQPDLGLWLNFVKTFNIADPYCFTYGGVELHGDTFEVLKKGHSALLPKFKFEKDKDIFTIKTIRPIFDYLIKNQLKAFEAFLSKNKINIEVFYILNHPLTLEFINTFFSFLEEHKINEKSLTLLDFNFNSSMGAQSGKLLNAKDPDLFFSILGNEQHSLLKYKFTPTDHSYLVSLSKKNQSLISEIPSKEMIMNYHILYPYYFLKSTKQCKNSAPQIINLKKNSEWQISYAS